MLAAAPVPVIDTEHIAPVRASVRDAVASVLRLLPESEPMSFRALVVGVPDRLEVIVRFLAVLELYKQGMVDVLQFSNFGELLVRRLQDGESVLDVVSLGDWDDAPDDDEPDAALDAAPDLDVRAVESEVRT